MIMPNLIGLAIRSVSYMPSSEQQLVVDYIDSLNLDLDDALVLQYAISGWNVVEWDFTF